MTREKPRRDTADFWRLARRQHGVISRAQLLELGFGEEAIEHRMARGRLHRLWRGVYAVGTPETSRKGQWMGAVLSCGPEALLSHRSAAALWGLLRPERANAGRGEEIDIVVPEGTSRNRPGVRVRRRSGLQARDRREVDGIPVTDPASTLVDLASCAVDWEVEGAINAADRLGLVDPETLRAEIASSPRRHGIARMRRLLGGEPLSDTGLERRFLAIVCRTHLPMPETQANLNGYRVDFFWPRLGLVVEADGWRYHRTAGEQATDHRRDQAHATAGLTTLRFAEQQIRDEPNAVRRTLVDVARRLDSDARSTRTS
jgi:very-short-patch-repair endonuclease